MSRYTVEQVEGVLSRKDVQIFLERRTGLCVGGCGTEVPFEEDTDLMQCLRVAILGHDIENYEPQSRLSRSRHDKQAPCYWCNDPFAKWLKDGDAEYVEDLASIKEVLEQRPLAKEGNRWVLGSI